MRHPQISLHQATCERGTVGKNVTERDSSASLCIPYRPHSRVTIGSWRGALLATAARARECRSPGAPTVKAKRCFPARLRQWLRAGPTCTGLDHKRSRSQDHKARQCGCSSALSSFQPCALALVPGMLSTVSRQASVSPALSLGHHHPAAVPDRQHLRGAQMRQRAASSGLLPSLTSRTASSKPSARACPTSLNCVLGGGARGVKAVGGQGRGRPIEARERSPTRSARIRRQQHAAGTGKRSQALLGARVTWAARGRGGSWRRPQGGPLHHRPRPRGRGAPPHNRTIQPNQRLLQRMLPPG